MTNGKIWCAVYHVIYKYICPSRILLRINSLRLNYTIDPWITVIKNLRIHAAVLAEKENRLRTTRAQTRGALLRNNTFDRRRQLRAWPIRRLNRMRFDRIGESAGRAYYVRNGLSVAANAYGGDTHRIRGGGAAMRVHELKACSLARSQARAPCAPRANSRSRESRRCGPPVLSTRPARLRSCCAPVGTGVHLTRLQVSLPPSLLARLFLSLARLLFITVEAPPRVSARTRRG